MLRSGACDGVWLGWDKKERKRESYEVMYGEAVVENRHEEAEAERWGIQLGRQRGAERGKRWGISSEYLSEQVVIQIQL